jgi:hypothetical protein
VPSPEDGFTAWWRAGLKRREENARDTLAKSLLLELRRAAFGSDVPAFVNVAVLTDRLRKSPAELEQLLEDLVAQKLAFHGLSPPTHGVRPAPDRLSR